MVMLLRCFRRAFKRISTRRVLPAPTAQPDHRPTTINAHHLNRRDGLPRNSQARISANTGFHVHDRGLPATPSLGSTVNISVSRAVEEGEQREAEPAEMLVWCRWELQGRPALMALTTRAGACCRAWCRSARGRRGAVISCWVRIIATPNSSGGQCEGRTDRSSPSVPGAQAGRPRPRHPAPVRGQTG